MKNNIYLKIGCYIFEFLEKINDTVQYRINNCESKIVFSKIKNKKCDDKVIQFEYSENLRDLDILFDRVVLISFNYISENFVIVDDFTEKTDKHRQGFRVWDHEKFYSSFVKKTLSDIHNEEYNRAFCRIITFLFHEKSVTNNKGISGFDKISICGKWREFHEILEEFQIHEASGIYIFDNYDHPVFSYFGSTNESTESLLIELCIIIIFKFGDDKLKIDTIEDFSSHISSASLINLFEQSIQNRNIELAILIFNVLKYNNPSHSYLNDASREISRFKKIQILDKKCFPITDIENLTGNEFENVLINNFLKLGFKAINTPKTKDFGCDIVVTTPNDTRIAIQCKRFKTKVNLKAVQEVIGALKHYQCDFGIVITNSSYFDSAIQLAKNNGIELWDNYSLVDFFSGELSFSEINRF